MNLADYFSSEGRGAASRLANAVGAYPSDVSDWASGARPVPPIKCPAIQAASGEKVKRWDLRPDDWHLIWPELVGTEGAPKVAGTATEKGSAVWDGIERRSQKARA